jgi:hypothetical protein
MKEPPDSLGSWPEPTLSEIMKAVHNTNHTKQIRTEIIRLSGFLKRTKRRSNAGAKPIPYVRIIPRTIEVGSIWLILYAP